jgi:hypothetical protein
MGLECGNINQARAASHGCPEAKPGSFPPVESMHFKKAIQVQGSQVYPPAPL